MGTIQDKLNYLNTTKGLIKQAIIDKGQTIADTDTFRSYANKINAIKSGSKLNVFVQDTEPATKEGIWIKASNKTLEKVITDENVYASETWGEVDKTLPYDFYNGSAVAVDTDIYLFGGGGASKSAYKYDTTTNIYTELTDIPFSFRFGSAVSIGTNIYLFGGSRASTTAYKYDTLTNTYTLLSAIRTFYNGSAVAVGTDIYLLGGNSANGEITKYNTITETFTTISEAIPYDFENGAAVAVGTDIYLFGGGDSTYQKFTYKYDTLTNVFTKLSDIPIEFSDDIAVTIDTNIYLFFGKKAYKYDTLTNTYTQLASLSYSTDFDVGVRVNNEIYILGTNTYSNNRRDKVIFTVIEKEYENNTAVIAVGINKYKANLINNNTQKINTYFYDAWFNTTANGLEKNNPTYYGNGTEWICFKNDPTEGGTE